VISSLQNDGSLLHRAFNACLTPLYSVEGMHVITVEGIGTVRTGLHPIQQRLAEAHGSQCGFCTPGFVMSMYALLRSKANLELVSEEDIEECLAGNLCRCTGYRPIVDAFRPFATYNGKLCPSNGMPCDCDKVVKCTDGAPVVELPNGAEPIFPSQLRKRHSVDKAWDMCIPGKKADWYRPSTLKRLLEIKSSNRGARLIVGGTELSVDMRLKQVEVPVFIAPTHIAEMNSIQQIGDEGIQFGASVTLTKLMSFCQECSANPDLKKHHLSSLQAIGTQLRWFAGPSIRNGASIGGNICTASPISDLNPLWIAAGATFQIACWNRKPRCVKAADFFVGYRKVDLQQDEVLVSIFLPFTRPFEYVKEFKQARRREDDIAIVNAGIRIHCEWTSGPDGLDTKRWVKPGWHVLDATLAFGGVGPITMNATKTASALVGRRIDDASTLQTALSVLQAEVGIEPNAPGGMVEYRRCLAASFLFKAVIMTCIELEKDDVTFMSPIDASLRSVASALDRPPPRGLQYVDRAEPSMVVGQPHSHKSAALHVTGEAQYVDDVPLPPNTLHAAFILSSRPLARIVKLDGTRALALADVVSVFTAADIPGSNSIGAVVHDEELFAAEIVTCVGQPLGIVIGRTEQAARSGARAVTVEYEDLPGPPILDIDAARQARSFYQGWGHKVERVNVDTSVWNEAEVILESDLRMGGQEHFYLEPNAHLVIPGEGDEITSLSSTQCPEKHQRYIAQVLGIPMHKVTVKTKRVGGGFGGKETRAAFVNAAAAVAAAILRHPVRLVLDRDEDMAITGQRHPFYATYKVGARNDGRILSWTVDFYSNAGNSLDLSGSIMDRALMSCDSVYNIPGFRAQGYVCKTNLPSNTAFRGFGGPQGMMAVEHMIDRVSKELNLFPEQVRELNMYKEGDQTPYGMRLEGCQALACWLGAMESAGGMTGRREEIRKYNNVHRFRKRGIAAIPTKFGISFTTKFLNQAGALVHIYQGDGTVLVTHGGVEMGQGLHTKVCQIVAQTLGVPFSDVHVAETSTDKVPNASPTAASASSDMYGAAAASACEQLNERLAPFKSQHPNASFKEIVQAAYLERVDLSAHGFYSTPDITGFGGDRPFNYFTYGAAVTEVELDTLTGNWFIVRSDIVMDVGKSLNPAIDIGQVEGAFVQGFGWACLEELIWGDPDHPWVRPGTLFTRGPGNYKIPTANDIPTDFRVTLLRNAPCARTPLVHSSKAVGEPPFFLGTSVFWALKDAVYAARSDAGVEGWFPLDLPCTPERLRMACVDDISVAFVDSSFRSKLSC
jgi:xanthine dehydrogenase/oxidase